MSEKTTGDDLRATVELQELLLSSEHIDEFLQQLTAYAANTVGNGMSCGITLRRDGRPTTVASSDDRASKVDEVQYGHDRGPCLSSMRTGEVNLVEDLADDDRWGAYRAGAMANGVRSSLSIPLVVRGMPTGAFNFYAGEAHAFGAEERAQAERFGVEASRVVALAIRMARHAELSENLQAALASRTTIDQALGVVMGQNRCTADEAFQILRAASQNRNVKLRDIAAEIIKAVTGHPSKVAPRLS
jgi:GAF domain-containing protein